VNSATHFSFELCDEPLRRAVQVMMELEVWRAKGQ
jgi:hypothetical protein